MITLILNALSATVLAPALSIVAVINLSLFAVSLTADVNAMLPAGAKSELVNDGIITTLDAVGNAPVSVAK